MAFPTRLGCEQPDVAAVGERRQRVHQGVDKITIAVPPPEQNHVDDVIEILVDKLHILHRADRVAHLFVAVIVIADFLHHLARLDAKPAGQVALVLRLACGRAH